MWSRSGTKGAKNSCSTLKQKYLHQRLWTASWNRRMPYEVFGTPRRKLQRRSEEVSVENVLQLQANLRIKIDFSWRKKGQGPGREVVRFLNSPFVVRPLRLLWQGEHILRIVSGLDEDQQSVSHEVHNQLRCAMGLVFLTSASTPSMRYLSFF